MRPGQAVGMNSRLDSASSWCQPPAGHHRLEADPNPKPASLPGDRYSAPAGEALPGSRALGVLGLLPKTPTWRGRGGSALVGE